MALAEVCLINAPPRRRPAPDESVSFLPMSSVGSNGRTESGIDRPFADVSKGYTLFERADLLVAKITPCFENGKIAQAMSRTDVAAGSTEFHVVRPLLGVADSRYVLHQLRHPHVRAAGERRMTGSGGQRRVPESFLRELEIPLPSIGEQRRLAAILDEAEELRAKRRASLALLDSLSEAIFLDMFGDPITNSMGWDRVPLRELGVLDRGVSRHRPRNAAELLGGGHPLIQTGDVANSGGYIRSYYATYSDFGLRQSKMWPAGTLCITIAANIAKTGILTFDSCFPDSVVGFTTCDRATVEYVRAVLNLFQKRLEDAAPESAQKNINLQVLRELKVPAPPRDLTKQFGQCVKTAVSLAEKMQGATGFLDTLFASLQHRAFAGQL